MNANSDDAAAGSLDSRTSAFQRNKRPRDIAIDDDNSNFGSANSTPKKRARRADKLGYQDVRDFVPAGATFSSSPMAHAEGSVGEAENVHAKSSENTGGLQDQVPGPHVEESSNAPLSGEQAVSKDKKPTNDTPIQRTAVSDEDKSMETYMKADQEFHPKVENARKLSRSTFAPTNWNAVNKIKIRTSLGRVSRKGEGEQILKKWDEEKKDEEKKNEEQQEEEKQDVEKRDEEKKGEEQQDEGKQNQEHRDEEDAERHQQDENSSEAKEKATQVALQRVECFRDRLSDMDPYDEPVSAYKAAESELHDAEVDYNYCLHYPANEEFLPPPSGMKRELSIMETQDKHVQLWKSIEQSMDEGTLENLKYSVLSPDRERREFDQQRSPAINEGLMVNVQYEERPTSGYLGEATVYTEEENKRFAQELEQIRQVTNDIQDSSDDSGGEVERESESGSESENESANSESVRGSEGHSKARDAMMEYSNSEQPAKNDDHQAHANMVEENSTARVLADLSPQGVNAQLRYFHVTKTLQEVDQNTPVRCLVCAQHGHMSEACGSLTCATCGAYNQHTNQNCPKSAKCAKCREQGHDRAQCPYKLKKAHSEVVCDLCQRIGHTEEDCELLWRTSGRPWESNISRNNLRLSCYECGQSGHLGNDCPTRKPGKSMGTSSWSVGNSQISIKSKGELSIKGRAQKGPIDLDDSQDEHSFFHRPKVPEPAGKGQIKINTAHMKGMLNHPPMPEWTPINEPSRNHRGTEARYLQYENDGRGNWRSGGRVYYDATQENNYRSSYLRSMSPHTRNRARIHLVDRYQPPEPREERRPPRGASLYRPMPSAAQNQWSRHRL